MLSLERVLTNIKAQDTVVIQEEVYKVKNLVAATDGEVLKAQIVLVNSESITDFCISVEVSSRIFDKTNLIAKL
mgnify:CR=1 FL=1